MSLQGLFHYDGNWRNKWLYFSALQDIRSTDIMVFAKKCVAQQMRRKLCAMNDAISSQLACWESCKLPSTTSSH